MGTTNDYAPLQVDANGALKVEIFDGGDTLTVDGSGVTQPVSAASLPLPSGAATAANQLPDGHNVTIDNASGASAVNIQDGGNSITVDGTVSVTDGLNIEGDIAHDSADSGNPLKVGFKAIAHSSNPTAVAANDRTDWYANRHGVPWVIGGHPNIVSREYMTTGAQTNDAIIDSIGAGTKVVVTEIEALASAAGTTTPQVRIGFGATAVPTEPTTGNSATDVVLSHPGIAAGSGVVRGSGAGIVATGGDGEELRITCDAPTDGQLTVLVSYYTIES